VHLLSSVRELAWAQNPVIWFGEACVILWLVIRQVRSSWVRAGVTLVLSGLIMNVLVTAANAGTMPVVGMPLTIQPASPIWQPATAQTRLTFLADQARLGLFSIGDLVMLFGGMLMLSIFLRRVCKSSRRFVAPLTESSTSHSVLKA